MAEEEGGPPLNGQSPLPRSVTAAAYYCQDFQWEHLRDEIEHGLRLQGLESPSNSENTLPTPVSTKEAWEKFHKRHGKHSFFKERRYLVKEFPELLALEKALKVLEIGCGTGSSVLPILRANIKATVYACDCSEAALKRAQELASDIDPQLEKCRFIPFYCDLCTQSLPNWLFCGLCRESLKARLNESGQDRKRSIDKLPESSLALQNGIQCGKLAVCPNLRNNHPSVEDGDVGECSTCGDSSMGPSKGVSSQLFSMHLDEESLGLLPDCVKFSPSFAAMESSCCAGGMNIVMMVFTLSSIPPQKMQHVIKECYSVLEPGGLMLFRDYGLYDMTMLRFPTAQRVGERLYQRGDGTLSYFFTPEDVRDLFTKEGFLEGEISLCCVELMNRQKSLPMKRVWIHAKFSKPRT